MIRVVMPVLFLLVASSLSTPLDSWEGSKDWEDQNSWRSVKTWEDNLNWNNKKNLKEQKGWGDEIGLGSKNWDSFLDSTLSVENHNWNRKKRSLEGSENAATVLENQAEPANNLIAPAVIAVYNILAAPRQSLEMASLKECRSKLALYEVAQRRYTVALSISATFMKTVSFRTTCNHFCCYPELN